MEGGGNGGSCDMCHITLKTLRTCTKCEGWTLNACRGTTNACSSCLMLRRVSNGFNEAQFEALVDFVNYFCSYYGPKIQSRKKYIKAQYMAQKKN